MALNDLEQRKIDLVAYYEEDLNLSPDNRMTEYFGDYGLNVKKQSYQGFNQDVFNRRFYSALTISGLTEEQLISDDKYIYGSEIKKLFESPIIKNKQNIEKGYSIEDQEELDICD